VTQLTPASSAPPALQSAVLLGICGSGMRSLAELLSDEGWRLWGTDQSASPADREWLQSLSIDWLDLDQLATATRLRPELIYSPSVPESEPHRRAALAAGLQQSSLPEFLGRLMQGREVLCVAGTHGKSTTTALLGTLLREAGLGPAVFLGAQLRDTGRSGWAGGGNLLVAESCEYRGHFHHYSPRGACLLSVEGDHFDCYPDREAALQAYLRFVGQLPPEGLLVVDSLASPAADWGAGRKRRWWVSGLEPGCDWRATDVRLGATRSQFRIESSGHTWGHVDLPLPGLHNVRNALAATALASAWGVTAASAIRGLSSFPGLRRRFEILGTWGGVTHVDDYAHHPTAIRCTLATARAAFPGRRVVTVFQPHQASRTEALFHDFVEALAAAPECHLAPIFAARESLPPGEAAALSQRLVDHINLRGGRGFLLPNLDPFPTTLDDALQPGDVLLVMGAGDIHRLHHVRTRRFR